MVPQLWFADSWEYQYLAKKYNSIFSCTGVLHKGLYTSIRGKKQKIRKGWKALYKTEFFKLLFFTCVLQQEWCNYPGKAIQLSDKQRAYSNSWLSTGVKKTTSTAVDYSGSVVKLFTVNILVEPFHISIRKNIYHQQVQYCMLLTLMFWGLFLIFFVCLVLVGGLFF